MKKLFTTLLVSLCGTMVYAQSVSVSDVTMSKGSTQKMEVKIVNPSTYTAFQFDLKLPKGISVKDANMNGTYGTDRKLEKACVDESSNTYRFLSYDMKNATLTGDGVVATITLEAGEEAETATLTGSDLLVVTPDGMSTPTETASATITVSGELSISIPAGGKLAMVSDNALDFTSLESVGVKAYIASGYEYDSRRVWLTRVNQVPGGTPIVVIGEANSTPAVPIIGKSLTYYGENLLKGSATAATNLDWENYKYFVISKGNGQIGNLAEGTASIAAEKVCIQVPQDAKVASSVKGSDEPVTIAAGGRLAYVNTYDLDFSGVEGLTAYTVTGFGEKIMWLTEIQIASAGTPLLLKGTPNQKYEVPSASSQKSYYANMLRGSATEALPVKAVDGDYITLVLSKTAGQYGALSSDVAAFPKGTSYLPVLAAYNVKTAAARGVGNGLSEFTSEVISMSVVDGDGDATGISRIASEAGNDTWYNLKGQRIDTPTKKGLYIKNGKKVIVR